MGLREQFENHTTFFPGIFPLHSEDRTVIITQQHFDGSFWPCL